MTDNFQDGTTQNWIDGRPPSGLNTPPANISTGGPAGSGDRYLQITADGSSQGGRLIAFNRNQWLGDYIASGATAISMDLENLGTTPLLMRIAFRQTTAIGAPGYVSTTPFSLPVDGLWHHALFQLAALTFTPINAPNPFDTVLTAPAEFRILSSATPSLMGDILVGQVGVDNIALVPEPTAVYLATGFLSLLPRFRARRLRTNTA